jgi:pilus assembly protein HofO
VNEALQRWMHLALPLRVALLLGLALLVLALAWLVVLLPQQQANARQEHQLRQQAQLEKQRQQQLASRPSIAGLLSEINALQQPTASPQPRLLLESLLAERGAQLDAWQPESQPQHIVLKLNWQQFTPLFAELAHTALPVPERFQLQAEQGTLMTQLWLENRDEE